MGLLHLGDTFESIEKNSSFGSVFLLNFVEFVLKVQNFEVMWCIYAKYYFIDFRLWYSLISFCLTRTYLLITSNDKQYISFIYLNLKDYIYYSNLTQ